MWEHSVLFCRKGIHKIHFKNKISLQTHATHHWCNVLEDMDNGNKSYVWYNIVDMFLPFFSHCMHYNTTPRKIKHRNLFFKMNSSNSFIHSINQIKLFYPFFWVSNETNFLKFRTSWTNVNVLIPPIIIIIMAVSHWFNCSFFHLCDNLFHFHFHFQALITYH